ncbi:MAG: zinc-ribbon domain-containing protein [Desulfobacterales bacterium]|nr:MAG: zinc-ribbon domain-containing protein [Desulfobacterales bacterium]
MDIVCNNCRSKFSIPNEKIPAGKVTSLPCPKCKAKITLNADKNLSKSRVSLEEIEASAGYDAHDKPFDFIEEEGQTALVCEQDPAVRKIITDTLHLMEYQTTVAEGARDALKRMRYHVYDLIVVNEKFESESPESNGVLIYIERMSMADRRHIFVAMISSRYRTMDNMMAFNHSVNLIINIKNIKDIGKILSRGLTDNELFYQVFKETLKEYGHI